MNLFYNLPTDVQREIWKYDPTFKLKFKKCLKDIIIFNKNMNITKSQMELLSARTGNPFYINDWLSDNGENGDKSFSKYTLKQIKRKKNRFMNYMDSLPDTLDTIPPWAGYNYPGEYICKSV